MVSGEVILEDDSTKQIAVKILKEGVSREASDDFKREVQIMSSFDHENILKLVGIVVIGWYSPTVNSLNCFIFHVFYNFTAR